MDQPLIIIAFVVLAVAIFALSAWLSAKRRKELQQWATARGLSFDPGRDHGYDSRYSAFDCLRKGDNRFAYNIMEGRFQDRPFAGFDYHYETHSRDSKGRRQTHHHRFSAVILGSDVPLNPLFIRPEGFFDKVTEFFGLDDIDFESAEFSRKFFVKSSDKRWAYDVLHSRAMEFLLSQPMFTMQFDRDCVIAFRSSTFSPPDFEAAAMVVHGILERFPEYLVKQQLEARIR